MTISKRKNENELDKVISQGGHVAADNQQKKEGWINIQLRISTEMIDEIASILKEKRIGLSRNAWILEAIQEKTRNDQS